MVTREVLLTNIWKVWKGNLTCINLLCNNSQVHICSYSTTAKDYVASDQTTRGYPPSTNRSCCTVGEYLFHNAIESKRKQRADILRLSTQGILGVVNILTAFSAYLFWADWRRSSKWASVGFLFPFIWIFLINSLPFSKLADIDIDDATEKTSVYMMGQLGYATKSQLWNLGTGFMTDALRKSLMELGVEKMFSALECATGTDALVTGEYEAEKDTGTAVSDLAGSAVAGGLSESADTQAGVASDSRRIFVIKFRVSVLKRAFRQVPTDRKDLVSAKTKILWECGGTNHKVVCECPPSPCVSAVLSTLSLRMRGGVRCFDPR